jgi:hypothetical protein
MEVLWIDGTLDHETLVTSSFVTSSLTTERGQAGGDVHRAHYVSVEVSFRPCPGFSAAKNKLVIDEGFCRRNSFILRRVCFRAGSVYPGWSSRPFFSTRPSTGVPVIRRYTEIPTSKPLEAKLWIFTVLSLSPSF